MAKKFRREEKHLVLKLEDIEDYVTAFGKVDLADICEAIRNGRDLAGKKPQRYIVVNQDEPYAEKVWTLIEAVQKGDG